MRCQLFLLINKIKAMSLKTFFGKVGDFFSHIFDGAKKTWDKLEPAIQSAMVDASGIIAVINQKIDATPDELKALIQEKFPNLPLEKIEEGVRKAAEGVGAGVDATSGDLTHMLEVLQAKLQSVKAEDGSKWAGLSSLGAKLIAVALAPKGTKWGVFESLMEFVFRTFVKGKPA
jgi:hypothetical protein